MTKCKQINPLTHSDPSHYRLQYVQFFEMDSGFKLLFCNPNSKTNVLDFLSKKRREEKRKDQEEQKLKASLSEKLAEYERTQDINLEADDDHTELIVNGKKVRVAKTQIDLADS